MFILEHWLPLSVYDVNLNFTGTETFWPPPKLDTLLDLDMKA